MHVHEKSDIMTNWSFSPSSKSAVWLENIYLHRYESIQNITGGLRLLMYSLFNFSKSNERQCPTSVKLIWLLPFYGQVPILPSLQQCVPVLETYTVSAGRMERLT